MNMTLLWFVLGLVFFCTELFSPALVLLFFGIGAWAAACAAALSAPLAIQIACFILISLVTLFLLRTRLQSIFRGSEADTKKEYAPGSDLAGKRARVSKKIIAGEVGEVEFGGSFWRALADEDIPEGSMVEITGTVDSGMIVIVRPQ